MLNIYAIEEVPQIKQQKRDVLVADRSASIEVVLWEKNICDLEEGKSYNLKFFLLGNTYQ